MELKDVFTIVKADRYTDAGRAEIDDARRTYKPGEISEKTGLQKQPNGTWAPPKGAQQAAGAKPKEQPSKTASGKWQKNEDYLGRERISMKTPQGGKVSIYESDNPKQKNARFRVDTGSHYNEFNTMEEAKAFAEKQYGTESEPAVGTKKNEGKKPLSNKEGQSYVETGAKMIQNELDALKRGQISKEQFKQHVQAINNSTNEILKSGGNAGKKTAGGYTNAETGRRDNRQALIENPKDAYDFEQTVLKSIPTSKSDREQLSKIKSFMREEGADYKQALRSRASNLVDGNKSNGDHFPEKEKSIMKIAKAVGYDKELHKFIEEEYKGYDLGYSEDAAPRALTGDCKVRVKK